MNIRTEHDITPETAKHLRAQSGLNQREFWTSVCSNQSSGHWFEGGKRKTIPRPIRALIFLRYVAKLPIDVSSPEAAQAAIGAGKEVEALNAAREARAADKRARELADEAYINAA